MVKYSNKQPKETKDEFLANAGLERTTAEEIRKVKKIRICDPTTNGKKFVEVTRE